ncbi:MAG: NADH-quinone oxidoreductase subunit NuoE [Sulfuricellaceae bacterium]
MLSPAALTEIDREVAKYPPLRKQSAVMSALRIAQIELGWLSPETIEYVANYLEIPAIAAWEVATFYNMYELKPVGKYKLSVCTNLPCTLMGAESAVEYLQRKLGIGFNETTPDGKFSLKMSECMGSCGEGPLLTINNHKMKVRLTPEVIDEILAGLE